MTTFLSLIRYPRVVLAWFLCGRPQPGHRTYGTLEAMFEDAERLNDEH